MIKTESITINGKSFVRTFSDSGYMVERDGVQYSEAIDPVGLGRIYTETTEPVYIDEVPEIKEKAKAFDILMGVSE
jgi:hypothetical protein